MTSTPTQVEALTTARVLTVTGVWLALAVAVGASGRLAAARPPLPQLVLFALTAMLLALCAWMPALRAWAATVDVRALVVVHVSRFVGLYFLVLYGRGEVPWAFAVPGGWGDIAVAVAAVVLLLAVPPRGEAARRAYAVWNVAGLVDILFVVFTAARLGVADPASMGALLRLPLSLLPTFLVPIIIATHVIMMARLAVGGGAWRQRP